ncbi:hypothetical protein EZV62_002884 [Acer yangbiense]|uniref:Serine-threonine/tyrosine-protein kinase catalytic domain-containing protein n=1 Tax=Acer yangbiense TaxID=1000413 RepID=A0A5C7IYG5_9ROSI|nr:hypothetical protein EZV62_002884 [Acer yangbiense]
MGSDMSMSRDVYKFGILLLKMFMSRRPTDSIFSDGQTLHEFVKMTLLLLEVGAGINNVENSARQAERMEMTDVAAKLSVVREKFLVMEIAEPSLLLEVTIDNNNVGNFARLHGEGRVRMEECLVGALRIGVVCSMESPADRMEMTDVVAKLCAIRENFLNRRTGDVRPSSQ